MIKNKTLKILNLLLCFSIVASIFTGCYSVFSGGTGGLVVDAESTSNPKAGIANVDVYAYINSGDRDKDFNNWKEGTTFSASGYYGHTTTGADGSFTISKLVWKENNPDFGRDADYTDVYLLFYHENYGLTKGKTVVISDSTSDTVYAELTSVCKTTAINFSFIDVANDTATNNTLYVKVTVPQTTEGNPDAAPKVYDANITGSGVISVTYPRWINKDNRTAGVENTPEVTITYSQNGDVKTWKGCYNADNADGNYAFRADAETGIKKVISNNVYNISLYGKSTKLRVPSVDGQYTTSSGNGTSADDGIIISMKGKDGSGSYTIDLGEVSTSARAIGTTGTEKHGVFSGLGNGYTWKDETYPGKYSTIDVEVAGDGKSKTLPLRSDIPNYTVQLQ